MSPAQRRIWRHTPRAAADGAPHEDMNKGRRRAAERGEASALACATSWRYASRASEAAAASDVSPGAGSRSFSDYSLIARLPKRAAVTGGRSDPLGEAPPLAAGSAVPSAEPAPPQPRKTTSESWPQLMMARGRRACRQHQWPLATSYQRQSRGRQGKTRSPPVNAGGRGRPWRRRLICPSGPPVMCLMATMSAADLSQHRAGEPVRQPPHAL